MISKTVDDIRTDLDREIGNVLPNLDISSGAPERDMFIEAPIAGQLLDLWNSVIYTAKLHAPHTYTDDIETSDLLTYMSNYDVTPEGETYSEGTVTFYSNTAPTQDIIITDGTIVKTNEYTPVEFAVQGTYIMYATIAASYYNSNTERWEIDCSVKALVAGATSRAGANTVISLASGISGIAGVTNEDPITGGEEAETAEEALQRVLEKFEGRGLASTQGLINYIRAYATAINVVGANDPEMERDEGLGGMIDFYIIGETLTNSVDTITITQEGLETGLNVTYTSTGIILENQPVHTIVSLIVNDEVIPTEYFELSQDTGILAKSTQSSDQIIITSTGISNGFSFEDEDEVEVNYLYNSLLATIEEDLNSTSNHYQNRDYLAREMDPVTVAVYIKFSVVAGQDFDLISPTVETEISAFINSIQNAGSVERADIVGVVKAIATVDNVDLTTMTITPTNGGTLTAQGDILLDKNEYPIAGTITSVEWTNS